LSVIIDLMGVHINKCVTTIAHKHLDVRDLADRNIFLDRGPSVSALPSYISSLSTDYEINFIRSTFGIVIDRSNLWSPMGYMGD